THSRLTARREPSLLISTGSPRVGMADLVRLVELGGAGLAFGVGAAGEMVDRFGSNRGQHAEALVVGEDRRLHPRVPEVIDVVGGRQHRLVMAHRLEVAGDVVGHPAQLGQGIAHSAGSISAPPAMRRDRSLSEVYSSCQSVGPFDGVTCTAVTLYSGQ